MLRNGVLRGSFGKYLVGYSKLVSKPINENGRRCYVLLQSIRRNPNEHTLYISLHNSRHISSTAFKILKNVTKIRYFVLGGVGGGAVWMKVTYDKWKERFDNTLDKIPGMPTFTFPEFPHVSLSSRISEGSDSLRGYMSSAAASLFTVTDEASKTEVMPDVLNASLFGPTEKEDGDKVKKSDDQKLREQLHRAQEELLEMQQKFQREIDRLEMENKDLRKQNLLRNTKNSRLSKMRRSLIDMYSDVLDLLSEYDANYNIQDHLPRVVVVGDQSAGKTSVLEMIARARIFPRGSGEMMTRCPIMVTLTEGANHIAFFKGSSHEYNLSKEGDLKLLRQEVELRMQNAVRKGQTISPEVISMYVKGPGLPRMVLVDLPGMINTVTSEMSSGTKQEIFDVSRHYMSNPNAIILCIQDGSVDAERSIATDLVSSMDPAGKRTIFVLTKTDIAEKSEANPSRIKKILSGQLFPMKALGYFAVVTGTGNTQDSIDSIRQYEEDFFRNSILFKHGALKASQMTTHNLSFAVANCFWRMVRESIEQQSDTFKARKFNLETEWRNNFPAVRELDRDELFEKAKGEILDEVLSLSQVSPVQWEDTLTKTFWSIISDHAIEDIYLPAAVNGDPTQFKTDIDIKLKEWTDKILPSAAQKAGWEALLAEFTAAMAEGVEIGGRKDAHSTLFEALKSKVLEDCISNHHWQATAGAILRIIQVTALEDSNVPDKQQWDNAVQFMESTLKDQMKKNNDIMHEVVGPGWQERWTQWSSRTPEQHIQNEIKKELEKMLQLDTKRSPTLSEDEITTVKKNLETVNLDASQDAILKTWSALFRGHFLDRAQHGVQECRKAFYHRNLAKSELACNDVILFWRLQKMVSGTSNALRQQIMNTEARRLGSEVKQVLEDISHDIPTKKELLKGRQVDLAEELKRVRHIRESLEHFIEALKREKTF